MTTDIDPGAYTSPAALAEALDRARRQIIQAAAGDPQALLAALPQLWRCALLRGALAPADGRAMGGAQQERWGLAIAYKLAIMLAQGRHYREALALTIAEPARTWAMRGIAAAMAENGDSEQALTLADSIPDERQRVNAQVEIARALSKAQRWDEAIALARATGHYLDDIACDMAEAGRCTEALALLRTSGQGDKHGWAMGKIAASLARAGHHDQALAVAAAIRHRRQAATARDAVAAAMAEAGQYDQALALIRSQPTPSGFVPRALIAALGQAQRWTQAESLARSVKSRAPRPRYRRAHAGVALLALIRALCQGQRWDEALQHTQSLQQPWQRALALHVVALALAQAGHHDQALALAQGDAQTTADVHAAICAQLIPARQWDAATTIARAADGASEPLGAQAMLAKALAEAGEWPRLIALVAETWAASTHARHTDRELHLAAPLIARHPELAVALANAFPRAEANLRGLLYTQK